MYNVAQKAFLKLGPIQSKSFTFMALVFRERALTVRHESIDDYSFFLRVLLRLNNFTLEPTGNIRMAKALD